MAGNRNLIEASLVDDQGKFVNYLNEIQRVGLTFVLASGTLLPSRR